MRKWKFNLSPFSLWLLIVVAPIPFLTLLFHFIFNVQKLGMLEDEISRVHRKMVMLQESRQKESSLLASLKNPDPHYLDKNVESLTFLLPEIKKLEEIQSENPDEEMIVKRLRLLKDGSNRLRFSEEAIRANDQFRETEEKQELPVEINEEDLKRLLCLIEGVTIWPYGPKEGRPQLIVKDFKLMKKELSSLEKVFVVSLQLVKRENLESIP